MFKKMFISMACIMAAVTVCAAPKISFSQDTKEATMAAYLGAMAYEDCDLMWQLMDPAVVKVAIAGSGSEEAAKKRVLERRFQSDQSPDRAKT